MSRRRRLDWISENERKLVFLSDRILFHLQFSPSPLILSRGIDATTVTSGLRVVAFFFLLVGPSVLFEIGLNLLSKTFIFTLVQEELPGSVPVPASREPCTLSRKGPILCHLPLRLSLWIAFLTRRRDTRRRVRLVRYARQNTSTRCPPCTKGAFGLCRWCSSPSGPVCAVLVIRTGGPSHHRHAFV